MTIKHKQNITEPAPAPAPEIIDISEDAEDVGGELSRKSHSNGQWGREESSESMSSKHRIDDNDKDPNELSKKENTPKRVKVEALVDPSPESNCIVYYMLF